MLGVDGSGGAWITNPKISQGKSAADAIKFSPAYIIDRTEPPLPGAVHSKQAATLLFMLPAHEYEYI